MEKIFTRAMQGANLGGIIGAAIGTLFSAGVAIAAVPVGVSALCVAAVATVAGGSSSGAIGTLVGGGFGAAAGTAETVCDKRKGTR